MPAGTWQMVGLVHFFFMASSRLVEKIMAMSLPGAAAVDVSVL